MGRTDGPFEWLLAKQFRRSNLRDVENALRSGRLVPTAMPHRQDLAEVLARLLKSPDLSERERLRIVAIQDRLDG
jgi:hypothetical protein